MIEETIEATVHPETEVEKVAVAVTFKPPHETIPQLFTK